MKSGVWMCAQPTKARVTGFAVSVVAAAARPAGSVAMIAAPPAPLMKPRRSRPADIRTSSCIGAAAVEAPNPEHVNGPATCVARQQYESDRCRRLLRCLLSRAPRTAGAPLAIAALTSAAGSECDPVGQSLLFSATTASSSTTSAMAAPAPVNTAATGRARVVGNRWNASLVGWERLSWVGRLGLVHPG